MYICNLKLNMKKILIITAIIAIIIALVVEITSMSKLNKISYDYELNEENFTSILRDVHNNIDENLGKTVHLSGFVFKLPDFKEGYFVCGRDMLLDGEQKIVGFLCTYTGNLDLTDSEWVEITGTFVKGYYTSDMPVIQIDSINKITAPSNTFVKTPNFL